MIIKASKKLVQNYIDAKEENILVNNIYNDYLENFSKEVSKIDLMKNENSLYNVFLDKLEIDPTDYDFYNLAKRYRIDNFKLLNEAKYENDAYFKNIHLPKNISSSRSKLELTYSSFSPYQLFLDSKLNIDKDDYYREINHFGYFKNKFNYIDLVKNNVTWMSITPHEINTMETSIKKANGNVLILGLGLGYFPYMCSLKNNVTKIDIIELDKEIIDVFKKVILPQFKNKAKISIINQDALKFLENSSLEHYDFIFSDLWHNAEDGLKPYLEIKSLLKNFSKERDYRIEESIIAYIRRFLIGLFEENLNGYSDSNYPEEGNFIDKIYSKLYFKTKNVTLTTKSDIDSFLSDENIQKLADNLL